MSLSILAVGQEQPVEVKWVMGGKVRQKLTFDGELGDFDMHLQYRSKVWTHFFSFFKTAVEIGPVG